MHEFSAVKQMVDILLKEVTEHNVKRVHEVHITIGELRFLNPEQLIFAYEILTEGTVLQGSHLVIETKKGSVECIQCGYRGRLKILDDTPFHQTQPSFNCPRCAGGVNIVEGNEFIIRSMKAEGFE